MVKLQYTVVQCVNKFFLSQKKKKYIRKYRTLRSFDCTGRAMWIVGGDAERGVA